MGAFVFSPTIRGRDIPFGHDRPQAFRIVKTVHTQSGKGRSDGFQSGANWCVAAFGIPAEHTFRAESDGSQMFGALVDDNRVRAELEKVDGAGRGVCLLKIEFTCSAIRAVAHHTRAGPNTIGRDMPGERTTAAGKAQGIGPPGHYQAAVFLLAAFGDAFRAGVRLALAFMKSMTSGRMLSRQLRPAKMP